MNVSRTISLALCSLALAGTQAFAVTIFTANLTTDQEPHAVIPTFSNGSPRPISYGTATFTLNDAQTELSFSATIFNIDVTGSQTGDVNDNLTAAHVHAGPNLPPAANPVVWGFFGNPFNNTMPNDGTLTPFANGVGGTFTGTWNVPEGQNTTLTAQLGNLFAGRAYVNFHTVQYAAGEIRGALQVPDTGATLAFLSFGLVGLWVARRPWRRA